MILPARPAQLPPALPEWDPRWSRLVDAQTADGTHVFHVLDTLDALHELGVEPTGTIVAMHGNPTWSFIWRRLAAATLKAAAEAPSSTTADTTSGAQEVGTVAEAAGGSAAPVGNPAAGTSAEGTPTSPANGTGTRRIWRVIAPDQLEMGFSERLPHAHLPTPMSTEDPTYRRIAGRVADFDSVISALTAEVPATGTADHPIITLGHDWGGVLSLTWGARNMDRVSGVMTLNTAVWHNDDEKIPAALRAALTGPLLPFSTVRTDAFLRTSIALSQQITPELTKAYMTPYETAEQRGGIGAFVADIPATLDHPSHAELQSLGADIAQINTPALILWGPRDPVFQERYLRDLRSRLPHADVHRFEKTNHLFVEDADYDQVILNWLGQHFPADAPAPVGVDLPERGAPEAVDRAPAEFQPAGEVPAEVQAQARAAAQADTQAEDPQKATDSQAEGSQTAHAQATPASAQAAAAAQEQDRTAATAEAPNENHRRPCPLTDADVARADRRELAYQQQLLDARTPMIFDALDERHNDPSVASVDMSKDPAQAVSWAQMSHVVDNIAAGLQRLGLKRGDRVSLLVPPGNNLTAAAYAVLKAGGVAVVADAGLGVAGMTRAVRSADPAWIIGETPGLTMARTAGWPGRRISVSPMNRVAARVLKVETSLTKLSRTAVRDPQAEISTPGLDDDAAILFTSGSTGPAKGVRYTHRALGSLATVLQEQFQVSPGTGLVAGFPPFALLGPGIGATSVTPDMSVTKPRTLTAAALADAVLAGDCTMVFASPAAYRNVVATASALTEEQRSACAQVSLALSAGAPVPLDLMRDIQTIFPNAEIHSPYGMTEGLLLTDITAEGVAEARAASAANAHQGVCVGTPIPGVRVALAQISADGTSSDELLTGKAAQNVLGEFVVSARHLKSGYDNLWQTDAQSRRDNLDGLTWHRTNDIGHIDEHGRLWIEGRLQHIITTAAGPVAPGGVEAVVDQVPQILRSGVVGIGPAGRQVLAVVLEKTAGWSAGLAPLDVTAQIRSAVAAELGLDVAAVLVAPEFPTDIRHNSKINREKLREWAEVALGGKGA